MFINYILINKFATQGYTTINKICLNNLKALATLVESYSMSTQLFSNYTKNQPEIVINATKIANNQSAEIYEFILNEQLELTKCLHIVSVSRHKVKNLDDFPKELSGALFEINHVRVNPILNNNLILYRFKKNLLDSGVKLIAPPDEILMAMCYKPIGELSEIVRFYYNEENSLTFLSKSVKLSIV